MASALSRLNSRKRSGPPRIVPKSQWYKGRNKPHYGTHSKFRDVQNLRFESTWETENLGGTGSATNTILLPMPAGPTVDWGDGTLDNLNTHTYAAGGTKTVKIHGAVTGFRFANGGDRIKITDVADVGGLVIDNNEIFRGCNNLTWTATNAPLITATIINNTFASCTVFNGNVDSWDVSGATNLSSFFISCPAFNQPLNSWDVSSATTIQAMFSGCTIFNQNIDNWDVSSVTNMASLFFNASAFNQPLNSWDVSSVENMISLLRGTSFNQSLSNWVTSSATNMTAMFRDSASFNQDISGFDVSGVTTAANMLNGSAFSTANYDLFLPAADAQDVQNNVTFHAGTAQYSAGAPATAHANLIADHSWTITDNGQVP